MERRTPSVLLKTFNYIFLFCTVWLLLVIAAALYRRDSHQERSGWIYGPDAPLMDSVFLDIIVGPLMALVALVLAIGVVGKEFILKPIHHRFMLNSVLLILTGGFMTYLINALIMGMPD